MSDQPSAAIVIPVLNEAAGISELIGDCMCQSQPAAEVIVIDAGSTDGTPELLAELGRSHPRLRVLEAPAATPGRGRNVGIESARSELIATLDAGCRIGPRWLSELSEPVRKDPAETVSVGTVEADAHSSFERAAGWLTVDSFKPAGDAGIAGREFLPAGRAGYCFTREAWRQAGGYPAQPPWAEDKLFLRRLRRTGYTVVAAHDAIVRWRPRASVGQLYRQYRNYGRGDVLARIDRQNELIPLALYSAGATLAVIALTGNTPAAIALGAATAGYLGLFVVAARARLSGWSELAWVPVVRVVSDLAKIHGLLWAILRPSRKA